MERRRRSRSTERRTVKRQRGSSSALDSSPSRKNYFKVQSWMNKSTSQNSGTFSLWKGLDFTRLGINYDTKNLSLEELFSLVENRCNDKIKDMPEVTQLLIRLTKDYFKLSFKNIGIFEANNRTEEDIKLVEDSNCQLNLDINEEIKKLSELIIDRPDNTGTFYKWFLNLKRFHSRDLKRFLYTLCHNYEVKERDYQLLFMKFTEIFLMEPIPGDCCENSTEINGEMFAYGADIKYERPQSTKSFLNVYVNGINKHNEKLYENIDAGKEIRVIDSLSEDLLNKVAKELLLERRNSCFCPGVIGILCCGTKIIFLYCEVTPNHYKAAMEKSEDLGDWYHSIIHFTKAYDYMSAEDRNEIIPYLFWLGYVQSSKYKIFDIS
ncbi:uncharacterized protein LOC143056443 [Mytilus galloprovincialis]|uniref:uncharacterized protein LOC143056443 n=1 Tax=Mytilus galloprovincialis TaxID=29158 RepID=UPI003F7C1294